MALFEALRGLILTLVVEISGFTWVAKLQIPIFHFAAGAVYVLQYLLDSTSMIRSHPSHFSTTGLNKPLAYWESVDAMLSLLGSLFLSCDKRI